MPCGSNATQVLQITTRLMIGPASMYAMQHDSGRPFRNSRRITTTIPHSHIGNTRPRTAPIITAGTTALGRNFVIACWGRNSSRMPATTAPSTMKGIASQRTPLNVRMKSEIFGSTGTVLGGSNSRQYARREPRVRASGSQISEEGVGGRVSPGRSSGQKSQSVHLKYYGHCPGPWSSEQVSS
jgi:hypothetical protein